MASEAHPVVLRSAATSGVGVRILCYGLVLVATVAGVIGWVLFDTDPTLWSSGGYWPVRELLSPAIVYTLGGAWLIGYRQARWPAIVLILAGLLSGAALLFDGLWWQALMAADPAVPVLWVVNGYTQQLATGLIVIVLPQLYPDGPLPGRLWRILLAVSVLLVLAITIKSEYDVVTLQFADEWFLLSFPLIVSGWLLALASLTVRWVRGDPQLRRQIIGFACVITLTILTHLLGIYYPYAQPVLLTVLAPVAVVASIGLAVLRYRLYDARPVVRRVVVYGGLTIVVTTLFVGVYVAVTAVTGQVVESQYRWAAALAAVAAVIAVEPLRRRIQGRLERRLMGFRNEPLRALARLHSAVAAGDADEADMHATMTATVAEAVHAPSAALALQRGPRLELVAGRVTSGDPLVLPLVYRGERLGELRVDLRTPGESYSRADRALLDQLAVQSSALVYAARRDGELLAARRDALMTIARERKQLGRDLHDSIAPLLAGAGLSAEALRQGMAPGSPDEQDASRLASRLRSAAGEVRRLAHDLQPAASVADSGLAAALADHVAGLKGAGPPEIRCEIDIGRRLPDDVEQAAYLVVLEAVTNVLRHAQAATCEVSVRLDADELCLRVADDGKGIAAPYISGIGITSMRSRVQALGGSFGVEAGAAGGTELRARIPVTLSEMTG